MGLVYAIANQKGGVGKTTTTVNLGACVADLGEQTLVVDLDPQCNATVALGLGREERPSSYDCLCGERPVAEAARPAAAANLWMVPANRDLAGAAVELPLARRSILAGIKTAAVINVGTATLGALIGAGGYGQPILTGIRLDDTGLILEGALPAALMALAVQGIFDLLERATVPAGLRRGSAG